MGWQRAAKAPEESLVHRMRVVVVAVAEHDLQLGTKRESIFMDASTYESVEELLANANNLHVSLVLSNEGPRSQIEDGWQGSKQLVVAMSTLNAHAAEWKATTDVRDGRFTG